MSSRTRRTTLLAAGLVLAVAGSIGLAGPSATASPPAAATAVAAASPADAARFPCQGYSGMQMTNPVDAVMDDRFTWSRFRGTKVGARGNINWRLDPYRESSWVTWFHSLYWTGSLIYQGANVPPARRTPATLTRAEAIAADWVRDNPYPWKTGPGAGNATMDRTQTLLCLREALVATRGSSPAWLDATLDQHAAWMRANHHIWGEHNVATQQMVATLGVGCVLDRADHRNYAVDRLAASAARVIDAQGANNEQALGYADFNWHLWGRVDRVLRSCGIRTRSAAIITSRRAALSAFLDHATLPDGTLHQLGDTQVARRSVSDSPAAAWVTSNGRSGAPPNRRVAVYQAGYVFGRSGWGTGARPQDQESAYALRFGPARAAHGHNDHTAVTWSTRGRPILIDTGTGTYTAGAVREHYLSPEAHNQLVMPKMKASPVTRLTSARVGVRGADVFEMVDAPLPGTARRRAVLAVSDPDVLVVVDHASSRTTTSFTQYWHLPSDQGAQVRRSVATASKAGDRTRTTLLQLPTAKAPATPFALTRGSTRPLMGWHWPSYFTRRAAPVVSTTRKGTSASIATAIVAAAPSTPVRVAARPDRSGGTTYTITVGAQRVVVALSKAGSLSRVG